VGAQELDGWIERERERDKNGHLYITSLFVNLKNAFCRNEVFKKMIKIWPFYQIGVEKPRSSDINSVQLTASWIFKFLILLLLIVLDMLHL
jgi:hypothetical protein